MDQQVTAKPGRRPKRPKPIKHEWFDGWMRAKGEPLKLLVERTVVFIDHHETRTGARQRARRTVDQFLHLKRVEAVVCHLAHAVLLPPPTGRIAIQVGHGDKGRSRYKSPIFGKPLGPLMQMLQDTDFVDFNYRYETKREETSTMAPSPWFARRVAECGVQLCDFGRDAAEEVIYLTLKNRNHGTKQLINYTDTPETRRYREEVRALNAFLDAADIAFDDDGQEPQVDPYDRTMRRRFVMHPKDKGKGGERFDKSGRLFGGFWQPLKSERRRHIRINGEPVATLDYSAMFTRLAYARIGAEPPPGDPYAIPGLEGYRSGVKLAMNCFLFDGGPRKAWPSGLGAEGANDDEASVTIKAQFPKDWGVGKTKNAILEVHPELSKAWNRQLGYHLMFTESQILIAILQELASRGIPALGLHDGLLVAQSQTEVAREVMTSKAKAIAGGIIPVTVKER